MNRQPVAYLRRSRTDDTGPTKGTGTFGGQTSWELQLAGISELAHRHGDENVEILWDWGRSGAASKKHLRAAYQEVRRRVAADEISVVYSYSMSRIGRSLVEAVDFIQLCGAHGVRVELAKEGAIDYASPAGKLYAHILAAVAEAERDYIGQRQTDAAAARRARGEYVGSAGFGKRVANGHLELHPGESLAEIVAAYRESGSFHGAARLLNLRGVPTKRRREWRGSVVRRILRREQPDAIIPALRTVVSRVKGRGQGQLFRLLRCPCGQILTPKRQVGAKAPYIGYVCTRARFDSTHPKPYQVSELKLLPWVKAEAARLRTPAAIQGSDEARAQRNALEGKRSRWIEQYGEGLIDKSERDRHLAIVEAELARLDDRAAIVTLPQGIDWTWLPDQVNSVLRAMWRYVELDGQMRPVRAEWLVPEWRAP